MKRLLLPYLAVLLLVVGFGLTGCGKSDTPPARKGTAARPAVVNATCPIMGGEVHPSVTGNLYTIFDGKGVGFCCPGCKEKFEALPDTEKAKKLAATE